MGETKDMNEYVQKSGCPGRDCKIVKDPRGIMYITKKAVSVAKDILAGKAPKTTIRGKTVEMDEGIACFLVSNCLPFSVATARLTASQIWQAGSTASLGFYNRTQLLL
jgi:hypothetical protein